MKKIVSTLKEEEVDTKEEKVQQPKSKVKVKEKARKLYKCIFILIISIIAFVLPFANLTGYDVFMGSNLITFFVSNSLSEFWCERQNIPFVAYLPCQ